MVIWCGYLIHYSSNFLDKIANLGIFVIDTVVKVVLIDEFDSIY